MAVMERAGGRRARRIYPYFQSIQRSHDAEVWATVPGNEGRLRTSVIASHDRDQLDRVVDAFERVGRGRGILGS